MGNRVVSAANVYARQNFFIRIKFRKGEYRPHLLSCHNNLENDHKKTYSNEHGYEFSGSKAKKESKNEKTYSLDA